MPDLTDKLDIGRLRLLSGEGRQLEVAVRLGDFSFGTEQYTTVPDPVPAVIDVSKMTGNGLALRLRLEASLEGPCMRCLLPAVPCFPVDVREVNQPGGGEELQSPYVDHADVLDVEAWAHDAFSLALPQQLLCREDCAGLCPECGVNLNADPEHAHERPPDPRWDALRELKLE